VSLLERVDRFQRRHPRAGLPIAVIYKFADDQGNYLAALITYYGFLSLFPLLLLSSTILGFVLSGHPHLQQQVLDSALGQVPIVGAQLTSPHGTTGSGVGIAIGILGTIYGGLGVTNAAQNAMNTIWRVPRNKRPNPITARLRGLLLLVVVGLAAIGTTALAATGSVLTDYSVWSKIGIGAGTLVLNAVVFTIAFRIATARELTRAQTVPGAVIAAGCWLVLQYTGAVYVGHVVRRADEINSVFAVVLGLIAWIYLEAVVVVLAVEYNSVRSLGLYPRALLTPFTDDVDLTNADEESYAQQAEAQRAKDFEDIKVSFDEQE
jgi:YihY family inner membrane protein